MKKFLAFIALCFCFSCGIKGPPLPPIDENLARKQKAESVTVLNPSSSPNPVSGDATKAEPGTSQKSKKSKK